ncbi:MAG: hypothetical protein D6793_01935 [Thermoflexia bacterium]|nr:MAG: hypothetical protein D6793_01935 [Thermoflexia bacterium]
MVTYRTETVVSPERVLVVRGVPFRPGERVEVIVLSRPSGPRKGRYPLRGRPIRYERPFDSVAEQDWLVLR